MLPPNTSSSLLPWSLVVLVMQVNGCFPYKMSEKDGKPVISLYLFLWGICMQLMMIISIALVFNKDFLVYFNYDVGTTTYMGTIIVMLSALCVEPVLLGVRSKLLADLLQDMSAITCVSPPSAQRWFNPMTMALLLLLTFFSGCSLWFGSTKMGFTNILGIIIFAPACLNLGVSFMLPKEVSAMVFGSLARRLLVTTEDTVARVSTLLAPDGSFKCKSDMQAAMLTLRDLDAVIREVGNKSTASYFEWCSMVWI